MVKWEFATTLHHGAREIPLVIQLHNFGLMLISSYAQPPSLLCMKKKKRKSLLRNAEEHSLLEELFFIHSDLRRSFGLLYTGRSHRGPCFFLP